MCLTVVLFSAVKFLHLLILIFVVLFQNAHM